MFRQRLPSKHYRLRDSKLAEWRSASGEAPRTSRDKFHDWLEKTIEETTETKDNNPETIEVRVFKNERN